MAALNQAIACQRRRDGDEGVALFRWAKVASPIENEVRLEVVPGTRELKGRDEWQLRHLLLDGAPRAFRMTLDLTKLDGIAEDGCQALRDFGAAVALQRR